jgi:hypothetical protein
MSARTSKPGLRSAVVYRLGTVVTMKVSLVCGAVHGTWGAESLIVSNSSGCSSAWQVPRSGSAVSPGSTPGPGTPHPLVRIAAMRAVPMNPSTRSGPDDVPRITGCGDRWRASAG